MIVSGFTNLLTTSTSSYLILTLLWLAHGFAQGVSWPSLVKVSEVSFSAKSKGTLWSLLSSSANVGSALTPIILFYIYRSTWGAEQWEVPVRLLSFTMIFFGGLCLIILPSTVDPMSIGSTKNLTAYSLLRPFLTLETYHLEIILLTLLNALTYFMVKAYAWINLYYSEKWGYNTATLGVQLNFWYEVGGILGTFVCGFVSDLMNSRYNLVSMMFSLGAIPFISMLYLAIAPGIVMLQMIAMFSLGFFLNGPRNLIGLAVREVAPPRLKGPWASIVGLLGPVC